VTNETTTMTANANCTLHAAGCATNGCTQLVNCPPRTVNSTAPAAAAAHNGGQAQRQAELSANEPAHECLADLALFP
jgi:hypothetical protein